MEIGSYLGATSSLSAAASAYSSSSNSENESTVKNFDLESSQPKKHCTSKVITAEKHVDHPSHRE